MLPTDKVVASRRRAIEKLYDSTCTVYVKAEYTKTNGSIGLQDVVLDDDIPCRVSFSSSPVAVIDGAVATVNQRVKIFLAPEIVVPAGSKIEVTTDGVTTMYISAGIPVVRDTHQSIELENVKDAC